MKLWIPGPTHVRPEILAELSCPMVGHRSQAMSELVARCDPGLRLAFGLASDSQSTVAVANHSASGMMEAALHGVGQRVLCVVNGAFARRWREIAELLGKQVTALELELGQAVTEERLVEALARSGPFDAVTVVVNETSTGVRTPLAPVARALGSETLLLVDVVSALGGYAVDFDALSLDLAFAGTQKALALPPGLTVLAASKRYLDGARERRRPSWFLDPVRTIDGHVERKIPATPTIPLYRALARQLEDISEGRTLPAHERGKSGAAAWNARFARHERLREATLAWGARRGIAPFPARELSSPTISCLRAEGIDVSALIAGLKQRGHEIGNGYGTLKGKTFRIGHMGDHTESDLAELLAALDEVLG